MAFKKFRKMKVYEASGYNYKRTPSIILKGDDEMRSDFDKCYFGTINKHG